MLWRKISKSIFFVISIIPVYPDIGEDYTSQIGIGIDWYNPHLYNYSRRTLWHHSFESFMMEIQPRISDKSDSDNPERYFSLV